MSKTTLEKVKEVSRVLMNFVSVILVIVVIGLSIQVQRRNHTVDKVKGATDDIQQVVNEFKRTAQASSGVDSKAVGEGLATIKLIEQQLQQLLDEVENK